MKQEAEGNYVVGTRSFSSQENMQKMFPGLIALEEGTKAPTFSLFSLFTGSVEGMGFLGITDQP